MGDPCTAPAPSATPTAATSPESRNFLVRLSRTDCAESPQKVVVLLAAGTMMLAFLRIAEAAARQISAHGIDGGTQAALLGLGAFVAGLAGYVHRTPGAPDGGQQ